MKTIKAFAPASIANFIVGFDALGACVEAIDNDLLGDIVEISAATKNEIIIQGKYAQHLPPAVQDNIVVQCLHAFEQELIEKNYAIQTIELTLEKRLPVSSGLGSSASSIIATFVALNAFYENPLSDKELLILAGNMEGALCGAIHYDNIAPSLLGGLQLMIPDRLSETLPWFKELLIVLYHPGIEVSTKAARAILPPTIGLSSAVTYWQKYAAFIHALYTQNQELAFSLMNDELIEPKRAVLIPRFAAGKMAAYEQGALAFGISGSGPSCFAIANSIDSAKKMQLAIEHAMQGTEMAFSKICKIASQGARILP